MRRVNQEVAKLNQEATSNLASLELLRADAAKPRRWASDIQRAVPRARKKGPKVCTRPPSFFVTFRTGCFAGLVGYLVRQEHELGRCGIPLGGGFNVARTGGFIGPTSSKGVIVVGKIDQNSHHVTKTVNGWN
jgi:hypothetical protein